VTAAGLSGGIDSRGWGIDNPHMNRLVLVIVILCSSAVSTAEEHIQVAFVETTCASKNQFLEASNEIKQQKTVMQRNANHLKIFGNSLRFNDWVGYIDAIDVVGSTNIHLAVRLPCGIHLETWNNTISDMAHKTLIPFDSVVGGFLEESHVGQKVLFSGYFFPGEGGGVYEQSFTTRGSMIDPEFLVRFTEILNF